MRRFLALALVVFATAGMLAFGTGAASADCYPEGYCDDQMQVDVANVNGVDQFAKCYLRADRPAWSQADFHVNGYTHIDCRWADGTPYRDPHILIVSAIYACYCTGWPGIDSPSLHLLSGHNGSCEDCSSKQLNGGPTSRLNVCRRYFTVGDGSAWSNITKKMVDFNLVWSLSLALDC